MNTWGMARHSKFDGNGLIRGQEMNGDENWSKISKFDIGELEHFP